MLLNRRNGRVDFLRTYGEAVFIDSSGYLNIEIEEMVVVENEDYPVTAYLSLSPQEVQRFIDFLIAQTRGSKNASTP
jgi:hypothetical protein